MHIHIRQEVNITEERNRGKKAKPDSFSVRVCASNPGIFGAARSQRCRAAPFRSVPPAGGKAGRAPENGTAQATAAGIAVCFFRRLAGTPAPSPTVHRPAQAVPAHSPATHNFPGRRRARSCKARTIPATPCIVCGEKSGGAFARARRGWRHARACLRDAPAGGCASPPGREKYIGIHEAGHIVVKCFQNHTPSLALVIS